MTNSGTSRGNCRNSFLDKVVSRRFDTQAASGERPEPSGKRRSRSLFGVRLWQPRYEFAYRFGHSKGRFSSRKQSDGDFAIRSAFEIQIRVLAAESEIRIV